MTLTSLCWCEAQHGQHRVRKPNPQDTLLHDRTQAQLTVRIQMVINELGSCFLIFLLRLEIIVILIALLFLPFKCSLLAFTAIVSFFHCHFFFRCHCVCVPK